MPVGVVGMASNSLYGIAFVKLFRNISCTSFYNKVFLLENINPLKGDEYIIQESEANYCKEFLYCFFFFWQENLVKD